MMHTLTKTGYDQFVNELDSLTKARPEALVNMVRMRELGDLSENAGYRAARSKLSRIDNRIRFVDRLLATSKVVTPNDNQSIVSLGTTVKIRDQEQKEMIYHVVDTIEIDLTKLNISTRCPLGKALMGKCRGDKVTITTIFGHKTYQIVDIL